MKPTSSHHTIDYIEFNVTDIAEAKRFYSAAFDWKFNDYGPTCAGIQGDGREVGGVAQVEQVTRGGPLVFYPAFSATVVGLIVVAARDGVLGSPWISGLGVVGLVANGIGPALVLSGFDDATLLFPLLMLFAVWLILSSLWGIRRAAERSAGGATVSP